jgi:hypothetical protein
MNSAAVKQIWDRIFKKSPPPQATTGKETKWKYAGSEGSKGWKSWNEKCFEEANPYSCYWCDRRFRDIAAVNRHTVLEHKYSCNACMKHFETRDAFYTHLNDCPSLQGDDWDTV